MILAACDAAEAPASTPAPAEPAKAAPSKPTTLAPAPQGATIVGKLYVQTCAAAHACPSLLHAAGEAHCEGLASGGLAWRLPTHAELKSLPGRPGLEAMDGFHWSRTPFADAPDQMWIFDPKTGSETTIPRDRKPFTVRCVAQP
jgi:hypothetical protein